MVLKLYSVDNTYCQIRNSDDSKCAVTSSTSYVLRDVSSSTCKQFTKSELTKDVASDNTCRLKKGSNHFRITGGTNDSTATFKFSGSLSTYPKVEFDCTSIDNTLT